MFQRYDSVLHTIDVLDVVIEIDGLLFPCSTSPSVDHLDGVGEAFTPSKNGKQEFTKRPNCERTNLKNQIWTPQLAQTPAPVQISALNPLSAINPVKHKKNSSIPTFHSNANINFSNDENVCSVLM
jgi:hypothetical protein